MPKLPVISAKDLVRALSKKGFAVISQRDSHLKLSDHYHTVIIPNHHTLKKGTLKKGILNPIGLSVDELIKLLQK